jgi:hypothetical protein
MQGCISTPSQGMLSEAMMLKRESRLLGLWHHYHPDQRLQAGIALTIPT